jgi:hypothetical protein
VKCVILSKDGASHMNAKTIFWNVRKVKVMVAEQMSFEQLAPLYIIYIIFIYILCCICYGYIEILS